MSYSADDIIGKTLTATKAVKIKNSPFDNAPVTRTVSPGARVGEVFSYVEPGPGRQNLHWMFEGQSGPYYAEHKKGIFDSELIELQIEQEQPAENWWNQFLPGNTAQPTGINQTLRQATTLVITIGVVALIIIAVPKIIKQ